MFSLPSITVSQAKDGTLPWTQVNYYHHRRHYNYSPSQPLSRYSASGLAGIWEEIALTRLKTVFQPTAISPRYATAWLCRIVSP